MIRIPSLTLRGKLGTGAIFLGHDRSSIKRIGKKSLPSPFFPTEATSRLGRDRSAVRIAGLRANFRLDSPSDLGPEVMLDPLGRRVEMIEREFGMAA